MSIWCTWLESARTLGVGLEAGSDLDRRRQGGAQQRQDLLDDGPERDALTLGVLPPAEGQDPPHEVGGAARGLLDAAQVLAGGMIGR